MNIYLPASFPQWGVVGVDHLRRDYHRRHTYQTNQWLDQGNQTQYTPDRIHITHTFNEIKKQHDRQHNTPYEYSKTQTKIDSIIDHLFNIFWDGEKYVSTKHLLGEEANTHHAKKIYKKIIERGTQPTNWHTSYSEHLEAYQKDPENANKKLIQGLYLKRTADQTLEDGFLVNGGCREYHLIFATLCRLSGIPARYMRCAAKERWLEDGCWDSKPIGHSFVEAYIRDNGHTGWKTYDAKWCRHPEFREFYRRYENTGIINYKNHKPGRYIPVTRPGLDSWDLGITDADADKSLMDNFKRSYYLKNP